MDIDPTGAPAVQSPRTYKSHDLAVMNSGRLMHLLVDSQQLPPASTVAYEKLPIDQFVSHDFVKLEKPAQPSGERGAIGEGSDPHGRIDQNHQRALRFGLGLSRRRGTSCASGSVPRRSRRRWYAA